MRFGFFELLIILAIIALIFGPKQIPKLTKALGDSVKSMKNEMKSSETEGTVVTDEEDEGKTGVTT